MKLVSGLVVFALFILGAALVWAASSHAENGVSCPMTTAKDGASCPMMGAAKASEQTCAEGGKPVGKSPVTFKGGGKTLSYRCLHCALTANQTGAEGVITTHSAISGKLVTLTRKAGKWSALPTEAVALSLPETGGDCSTRHLAFSNTAEFSSYLKSHPKLAAAKPKALSLTDVTAIIDAGRPPLPAQATCPVMHETFKPTKDTLYSIKNGKTYYFCCPDCKKQFDKA